MAKVNKKKSNKVGKVNKKRNQDREEAKLLLEKGETFGDAIISTMALMATNYEGMGIAAIGLAKALASLKFVAKAFDVNVEDLFAGELVFFEKKFESIPDEKRF